MTRTLTDPATRLAPPSTTRDKSKPTTERPDVLSLLPDDEYERAAAFVHVISRLQKNLYELRSERPVYSRSTAWRPGDHDSQCAIAEVGTIGS